MTTIDMPNDRETQQIQRTAKTQERQQNQMERTLDQRLSNTSGCTPSTYFRFPHTSTNPVTLGELNSEFCYVEATSAKTTQKELPQDNTITTSDHTDTPGTDQKAYFSSECRQASKRNNRHHRRHLEQVPWTQEHQSHQSQAPEKHHTSHGRQQWYQ